MIIRLEDGLPSVSVPLGRGDAEVVLEAGVVLDLAKLEVYPSS